jgi:fructose 1,6-bisphosphatase
MYLYIVDDQDKLLGVIDVKELLRADDEALLKDIMNSKVITLSTESTFKEAADKALGLKLYGAGQDLLKDSFSISSSLFHAVKGMVPLSSPKIP